MYLLVGNSKKQKQKEIVQILHAEVWTCVVVLCAVTLPCWGWEGRWWLFFLWLNEMSSQKHHDSCQCKLCRWFWSREETLLMLANKKRWWETSYNASCLPGLLGKNPGAAGKKRSMWEKCWFIGRKYGWQSHWRCFWFHWWRTGIFISIHHPGPPKAYLGHLQYRTGWLHLTLKWKVKIPSHAADRLGEVEKLSASCRFIYIFFSSSFLKTEILFHYSADNK